MSYPAADFLWEFNRPSLDDKYPAERDDENLKIANLLARQLTDA